jgi:hypothetical protein
MRRDELNDKEERRRFRPIEEMKGKRRQEGNYKKTRMGIPGLY